MPEITTLYEQIKTGQWFPPPQQASYRQSLPIAISSYPQEYLASGQPLAPTLHVTQRRQKGPCIDRGTMPEPIYFYGRQDERALLHSWMGQERSRFVTILGIAGQGKSALAATFVQEVTKEETVFAHGFAQIIWRSLHDAPSCSELLQDWLHTLCDEENEVEDILSLTFDSLVTRLFAILQTRRCLLVLDGWDALLATHPRENGECCRVGYRPGYEAYETLLHLLLQRHHQSCLLLTSRIRPTALTHLDERNGVFKSFVLEGLPLVEGSDLLQTYGIAEPSVIQQLYQRYDGNPLVLNYAVALIQDFFGGDIAAFLAEELFFLGEIGLLLEQQFAQLSPLEQQVVSIVAAQGKPMSRQDLWEQVTISSSKQEFFCALRKLRRSCWLQQINTQNKLPTLLAAYLVERNRNYSDECCESLP